MSLELGTYFERAARKPLRKSVLSGEAAIVFSAAFDRIVWANADGAQLFGGGTVAELLQSPISTDHSFIRQVHDAAEQIENDEPIVRGFRISRGLTSQFIQCELRPLTFDDGESTVLLTCALPDSSGHRREHERAQSAVDGLTGLAWASAILDGSGLPLAVSEQFARIEMDDETIASWLAQADASGAVANSVDPGTQDKHAAFVLRLAGRPQRYLVAFAGEQSATDGPVREEPDESDMTPVLAGAAGIAVGATTAAAIASETADGQDGEDAQAAQGIEPDSAEPIDRADDLETLDEADLQIEEAGETVDADGPDGADEVGEDREAASGARSPDFHGGMHQTVVADGEDESGDLTGQEETDTETGELAAIEGSQAREVEPEVADAGSEPVETEAAAAGAQPEELQQPLSVEPEDVTVEAAAADEGFEAVSQTTSEPAESPDSADAAAQEVAAKRPQPIRSLLERWFMRRGDEEPEESELADESGTAQSADTVPSPEAAADVSADPRDEHAEDAATDEKDEDQDKSSAGTLVAAGAAIVATTVALAPSREDGDAADGDEDQPDSADRNRHTEDEEHASAGVAQDDADVQNDAPDATQLDEEELAASFAFKESADPVRFAWTTDDNQTFVSVSPELAETVGPNAADIIGRRWQDLAKVFGFDETGEIAALLEKRDTWSGKSVLWPVQGADLTVPVDLAALPAFSATRAFEGFRGFGIIRTADAVVDPDEIGLALAGGTPSGLGDETAAGIEGDSDAIEQRAIAGEAEIGEEHEDADDMRTPLAGAAAGAALAGIAASNVVDLTSRKRASSGADEVPADETGSEAREALSGREAMAFEEIGRRLGSDSEDRAASPGEREAGAQTAILEQLPVPVIVYLNGHTLFANKELLEQTGYTDIAAIDAAGGVQALFGGGAISEGDDSAQSLLCRDGSQIEVSPLLKSVPWRGGKALLLTFRPTTLPPAQVREAIDIARVSELQNILDTASDGIIVIDEGGVIESLNAPGEQLFGTTFDKVARDHLTELFAQESHKAINEYVAQAGDPALPNAANIGREVIGKHADGSFVPLFITLGRMGGDGKLCAVLRNITQWKKAEEDLVSARQAAETASEHKSDFLARVSHEIRTPLNAIIGFSDVMIEERFGPVDNERYREYLRDINRSGVHILDLINDLLDISKIEAGKMELSFEAVDLSEIVAETVALLQPQANVERILIRTSLSRAVPRVVADARTIRQIVLNLVSNAIKFTPSNGQVIISTVYEANGEVVLKIRDTGKGMSEAELEQALKPFSQIGTVDERRGQGTGLGLPLTKALVEANRAHFDLESVPDEGTIALVQFPTQRVLAD